MRTSHLTIKKRIESEKLKITDEELFASYAFGAYLTDLAEAATKRYRRAVRVNTYWDDSPHADVACTDNRVIKINAGNFLTRSFPTRKLRADSLVGINAHEIGHVLFTDFTALYQYMTALTGGRMYPAEPEDLPFAEELNLSEIKEALTGGDDAAVRAVTIAAHTAANIIEDVYIEARMCDAFPGTYKTGILLNNLRFPELVPSVTKQIANGAHGFSIVVNLLIQYCKSGDINNLDGYSGEYLDALYDCIPALDDAVCDDDVKVRYMAVNKIVVKLWPYIKAMIEQVREDMAKAKSLQEALDKLTGELEGEIFTVGSDPSGKGKPVPAKIKHTNDDDSDDRIKRALEAECARYELEKTDEIGSTGTEGSRSE